MELDNEVSNLPLAIQSLFKDESTSDVEMVGNDDVRIQAHKAILAARSAVLKRLLFGSFSEANTSVVKVDYSGKVIECLAEYCYTDKFSPPTLLTDDDTKVMNVLVELAFASDYFALPGLSRQVKKSIVTMLTQKPFMTWQVLADFPNLLDGKDEEEVLKVVQKFLETNPSSSWEILATLSDQDLDGKLGKAALDVVRQKFRVIVNMVPPMLSAKVMEMVVSDRAILGQEKDFFRLIERWAGSSNKKDDNNDNIGPSKAKRTKTIQSDKIQAARSLIDKYIQFDRIKPSDLLEIVEPSDLVTKEAVLAAYKEQANTLERRNDKSFIPTRGVGWESSAGSIYECTTKNISTELLRCIELRGPGVYKWSMKLFGSSQDFETGVVAISSDVDRDTWLGSQKYGWSYECGGYTYFKDENKATGTKYGGDTGRMVIELTLDLTERGSLKAHFHDRQVPLFDNMLMDGKTKVADRAFVPAVSFDGPGKVEFLGFS